MNPERLPRWLTAPTTYASGLRTPQRVLHVRLAADSASRPSLEHRDGVHGRTRAGLYAQRLNDDHEFPPFELLRRGGELVEREVVEKVHAERDDGEGVNRNGDAWNGSPFLRHIAAEQRDIPFLQERDEGRFVARSEELRLALPRAPGPKQQRIAGRNPD